MNSELITNIKEKFFNNFLDVLPNTNVLIVSKDNIDQDKIDFVNHLSYVLGGKYSIINTASMRSKGNWLVRLIKKFMWPSDDIIVNYCISNHMKANDPACKPLIVFVFNENMTTKTINKYKEIHNIFIIDVRPKDKIGTDLPIKDEYIFYEENEIGLQIINRDLVNWIKSAGNFYRANFKKAVQK